MKGKQTKYIFVTGGVVSGLVKELPLLRLVDCLKARGYKVARKSLTRISTLTPVR